jgi:hypothetical protein
MVYSLDIAPHHIGGGIGYTVIPILGIGFGVNYTYNTETEKFEPGIKLNLLRW